MTNRKAIEDMQSGRAAAVASWNALAPSAKTHANWLLIFMPAENLTDLRIQQAPGGDPNHPNVPPPPPQ